MTSLPIPSPGMTAILREDMGSFFLGGCLQNVLPAEGSTQGFSITPARSQAKGKANTSLARRKVTRAKGTGVLEFVQGARVFVALMRCAVQCARADRDGHAF